MSRGDVERGQACAACGLHVLARGLKDSRGKPLHDPEDGHTFMTLPELVLAVQRAEVGGKE